MLVCPVCKYHHQQEVSKCQRCNWSMQDNLEINPEHPILKCIATLAKKLEEETASKKKIESQELDSHKLDEILDELEKDRNQIYKQFENINKTIIELKSSLLENKNNTSDVSPKVKAKISATQSISPSVNKQDFQLNKDINKHSINKSSECPQYSVESDRNTNNTSDSTNRPPQGSLYDKLDDPNYLVSDNHSENNSELNSDNSYHNFYQLIKQQEIEVTRVTVTKETMAKMRSGTQSQLEFANDRKGNYWIITWKDVYCLIPKEKININPYQYGNFQRVFNCQDYQETYRDFEVIEPATVISCDRKIWQLKSKGKIKFI